MRRALVTGVGGLYGAYDAGVLAELGRRLPPNYFSAIYTSSVGVFTSLFFIAGQAATIENTWRNLVDGRQLVNYFNLLGGREILDLRYLIEIFSDSRSLLDTARSFSLPCYVMLTGYPHGEEKSVLVTASNWRLVMQATCAVPIINQPVKIDGRRYIDGGLSNPLPIQLARRDGYDEVVVVTNKERGASLRRGHIWSELSRWMMPPAISLKVKAYRRHAIDIERWLREDITLKIIRPDKRLPLRTLLDTDKDRLNSCVDIGITDGKRFLNKSVVASE